MKKLLFEFVDANFKVLSEYQSLGFTVELDDPANNIYYVEMDLSNNDMLSVLAACEDCERHGLSVAVNIDGKIYDSKWDLRIIDELVSIDPLKI